MLAGCEALYTTGFSAHVYDLAGKMGATDIFTTGAGKQVRVEYGDRDYVLRRCQLIRQNSGPLACAIFPDGTALSAWAKEFMDGADCVVITPPNKAILKHELRHCTEGKYHL